MMIKIGHIYIYITRYRMKRCDKQDDVRRKRSRVLHGAKKRLYRLLDGKCCECGRPFPIEEMQIHHVKPVSQYPKLITRRSNLKLMCAECHQKEHK